MRATRKPKAPKLTRPLVGVPSPGTPEPMVRAQIEIAHVREMARYYNDDAYRKRYVHERYEPEKIARALRMTRGGIAASARVLGCAPNTLRRYIEQYPALAEILDAERELALDLAQQSLYVDAAAGDPDARRFLLLTLGRARGFVIRREVTGENGAPLNPADQQNTVIIVDGNKEQYIEKLRQARELARASLRVTPVTTPVGPGGNGDGHGNAQ